MAERKNGEKMDFKHFLWGGWSREYVEREELYDSMIERAAGLLGEAEHVLLGAGAGMTAAAGAQYGGAFFEERFGEFQKIYGKGPYMRDMYSAAFYPYPDEESRWGFFSRMALTAGADLDVTPLHRTLLDALKDKDVFLLTTNVDGQFEKAGLPAERIFATQGSYDRIQCARGCHPRTYDAVALFREMDAERVNGRVPSALVPRCPVCGGPMAMNLRSDEYFVQDEAWERAESRFGEFLDRCLEGKTALLELGVGFNTPSIIRFPFEKLVRERENLSLIRLSRTKAAVPAGLGRRAVGINADMAESIRDIAKKLSGG